METTRFETAMPLGPADVVCVMHSLKCINMSLSLVVGIEICRCPFGYTFPAAVCYFDTICNPERATELCHSEFSSCRLNMSGRWKYLWVK